MNNTVSILVEFIRNHGIDAEINQLGELRAVNEWSDNEGESHFELITLEPTLKVVKEFLGY